MLLFLSNRFCNLFSVADDGCWLHKRLGIDQSALVVHHGQINTWHIRLEDAYEKAVDVSHDFEAPHPEAPEAASECEIGKSAAYALGNGEEAQVLPHLESIALHGTCVEARKAAIHSIEGFGSQQARDALVRILWSVTGV